MEQTEGQQHPLGLYLKVWVLLFVLSFFSYMVDYLNLQGELRWFLILTFMWLKAGMIVAVFMHMRWERMTLVTAILVPPTVLAVLVVLMAAESGYVFWSRVASFSPIQ